MKIIELSKGKQAKVDDEDFERVSRFKWHLHGEKDSYAVRKEYNCGKKRNVFLHHFILGCLEEGMKVDHINHDSLDNRRSNLRFCTQSQNKMNSLISRGNRSGYKGVSWCSKHKKWVAGIMVNYRNKFLGYFHDKKEAAKAYDEAALKFHRKFYSLNKV